MVFFEFRSREVSFHGWFIQLERKTLPKKQSYIWSLNHFQQLQQQLHFKRKLLLTAETTLYPGVQPEGNWTTVSKPYTSLIRLLDYLPMPGQFLSTSEQELAWASCTVPSSEMHSNSSSTLSLSLKICIRPGHIRFLVPLHSPWHACGRKAWKATKTEAAWYDKIYEH